MCRAVACDFDDDGIYMEELLAGRSSNPLWRSTVSIPRLCRSW